MAVDMFLKIEGIPGESGDDKHKAEIQILSFSWGVTQSGSFDLGGGGGAGKANFQDFHFTMYANKATPKLIEHCSTGIHVKGATLSIRKAGGKQLDYMIYKFSDLLISSYQTGGAGGGDLTTESISFNYAKLEMEYKEQDSKGGLGGPIGFKYDLKANKKL